MCIIAVITSAPALGALLRLKRVFIRWLESSRFHHIAR